MKNGGRGEILQFPVGCRIGNKFEEQGYGVKDVRRKRKKDEKAEKSTKNGYSGVNLQTKNQYLSFLTKYFD